MSNRLNRDGGRDALPMALLGSFLVALTGACTPSSGEARVVAYDPPNSVAVRKPGSFVHGSLDLSVDIKNANPYCYGYAASISSKSFTPGPPIATMTAPATLAGAKTLVLKSANILCVDVDAAKTPLKASALVSCLAADLAIANDNLVATQLYVGDAETSIYQAWQGCSGTIQDDWMRNHDPITGKLDDPDAESAKRIGWSIPLKQRWLLMRAENLVANNLSTWQQAVRDASRTALLIDGGVKQLTADHDALSAETTAAQKALDGAAGKPAALIDPLKRALEVAKATEKKAADELDQAKTLSSKLADLTKSHDATQSAIVSLQTDALNAAPFAAIANLNDTMVLATQHFESNQAITIDVTRTPLINGRTGDKSATSGDKSASQDLGTINLYTLRPVFIDVGIGPAVTFERVHAYGIGPNNQVIETQSTAIFDALLNISAYYWFAPRYLDGTYTLRGWQWLPRPMLGASLTSPFSSIYVGGEWDPFPQFLDLIAGARLLSVTELVGPPVGALANKNAMGSPVAPSTKTVAKWQPFIGIAASTDLFTVWLKSIVKGP